MRLAPFAIAMSWAVTAAGAPRQFAIVHDAESTGHGNVEAESWIETGHPGNADGENEGQQNLLWWGGGRYGLLRNVELSGFIVVEQKNRFARLGRQEESLSSLPFAMAEVKWRPLERGKLPVDPFVQLQYMFWPMGGINHQVRLVAGASRRIDRLWFSGHLGYWDSNALSRPTGPVRWQWFDIGLAASYAVLPGAGEFPELGVGLEAWTIESFGRDGGTRWGADGGGLIAWRGDSATRVRMPQINGGGTFIGPSVSFTRGRLWGSAHVAFELEHAPGWGPGIPTARFIIGVAL